MTRIALAAVALAGVLATAGYFCYQQYSSSTGAFDEAGNAETLLFTFDGCGQPCRDARRMLRERQIPHAELNVNSNPENLARFEGLGGAKTMPYIVMGNQRIADYSPTRLLAALAAHYGGTAVRAGERAALERNFASNGEPRVVMYATATCGYCKRARTYFRDNNIEYIELDIDRDADAKRDFVALLGRGTPLLFNGYQATSGFRGARTARELGI